MIEQKSSDNHDDVFATLTKNFEKIHQSVEQLTSLQIQSLSNLQQSSLVSWKNAVCSGISILQAYAGQNFVDSNTSKLSKDLLDRMTNELIRSMKLHNDFSKIYWDVTRQNVEELDSNTETITELNKKFASFYQHNLKNDKK